MKIKPAVLASMLLAVATLQAQTLEWAKSFGGNGSDGGYSIAVDAAGNVYTTGGFQATADFDPGPGTFNLTSAGSSDVFVQKMDAAGNFVWAKSYGGADHDGASSISLDAAGNLYTTGTYKGTADFDPGAGAFNLTSAGNGDIFVQKMDTAGNFIWAKSFGGNYCDYGNSITADAAGNVYTTGVFVDTVDLDPGPGTFCLIPAGSEDIFIQKLDAAGNFVWAKSFGGVDGEEGPLITVDAAGNVYTTGAYLGTADFDPGLGNFNLTSAGFWDVFIQKMDSAGNLIWAKSFGGGAEDDVYSITVDAGGNVYTTGDFNGTTDFDPGAGTFNLTSAGYDDIFVQKMDVAGNFIWAKAFGGIYWDEGNSITIDAAGNVYTTGYFKETVDFDPGAGTFNLKSAGNDDIFVQKLDAAGNFSWAISFGGTLYDVGYSIIVDTAGDVYTTGYFQNTVDFNPGPGTFNLTSVGETDIFVHKMNKSSSGAEEHAQVIRLTAYPNPTTGDVSISFGQKLDDVEFVLMNVYGEVISKNHFTLQSGANITLDGPNGIYFLTIRTTEGQNVVKLVKN
ncbi:MAG TPA: T9SS type A sorting domain-containing protein [Bacteroidales bacterium]|nr:T9SS type A sorting domain-containing protein [Bacteroidales bacterium]